MGQILLFSYYSIISIPSEIIFGVSSYRKIYRLNLEYLSYIYRTISCATCICSISFNYGWCPFYWELPGIHLDAISPDAIPASDWSKQIRIYRGSASRKEDLGWNVSHLLRWILLILRPTSRATSPFLFSPLLQIFPRDAFHFTSILRSSTFTSTLKTFESGSVRGYFFLRSKFLISLNDYNFD